MKNRRIHFLIDKKLQLHYLFYIVAILAVISAVGMTGSYFGIWSSVVKAFSDEAVREAIATAAQLNEYEQARRPVPGGLSAPSIRTLKETSLLSERQQELIRQIMDETNQRMILLGVLLLIFIGWGSIFLTHKIAGPIYKVGQHFQILGRGNFTVRVKLRKFDEAHDLAAKFNDMAASLDAQVGKLKRILREASRESAADEIGKELSRLKTSSD